MLPKVIASQNLRGWFPIPKAVRNSRVLPKLPGTEADTAAAEAGTAECIAADTGACIAAAGTEEHIHKTETGRASGTGTIGQIGRHNWLGPVEHSRILLDA